MNERVQALAKLAGAYSDTSGRWVNASGMEKLTELIIEDCIQNLVDYGYTDAAACLTKVQFGPDHTWQKYEFPEI
jgi:hypothetical protein